MKWLSKEGMASYLNMKVLEFHSVNQAQMSVKELKVKTQFTALTQVVILGGNKIPEPHCMTQHFIQEVKSCYLRFKVKDIQVR